MLLVTRPDGGSEQCVRGPGSWSIAAGVCVPAHCRRGRTVAGRQPRRAAAGRFGARHAPGCRAAATKRPRLRARQTSLGLGVGFRQAEMLTASVLSPDDGGGWAAQGRTKREQALKQACICWAGRKVTSPRLGLTTTNSHNSLITFQSTSTSSRQQGDDVLAASVDSSTTATE